MFLNLMQDGIAKKKKNDIILTNDLFRDAQKKLHFRMYRKMKGGLS